MLLYKIGSDLYDKGALSFITYTSKYRVMYIGTTSWVDKKGHTTINLEVLNYPLTYTSAP
jgi:hypothetical protein